MNLRWLAFALIAVALTAPADRAVAMTVLPPTFPELVAEASLIADARVVSVTSRAITSPDGQKVVKTFVTFAPVKTLKGDASGQFTLSFLGGTDAATGERWVVPGMPTFHVGDEEILFATANQSVCPLVGAMHGRYRVETDAATGRRYVARENHAPLTSLGEIAQPMTQPGANPVAAARIAAALGPADFENRIAEEIAHPTPTAAHP